MIFRSRHADTDVPSVSVTEFVLGGSHDVLGRVPRRQHQDRCAHAGPPEFLRDPEAVPSGELNIQEDQVIGCKVGLPFGRDPIAGEIHGVPFFLEGLLQEAGDLDFIFDDEHPHRAPMGRGRQHWRCRLGGDDPQGSLTSR